MGGAAGWLEVLTWKKNSPMHRVHPFWPNWVFLHLEHPIALARASSRLVGAVLLAAALLAAALAAALAFLVLCTGTEYLLLSLVIQSLSLSEIWCSVAGGAHWLASVDSGP